MTLLDPMSGAAPSLRMAGGGNKSHAMESAIGRSVIVGFD
jgi:hypothetical protein